ncbi:MAG: M12 family metallo-peptidase [Bacteroidia bacterium]|nr:T9SS type A sorting domain-containing protein [Bacteroidia bacterium]MCZ2276951.1 M12 family metallo-peptidase [Bacteroidia bacterium]
MKRKLSGVFVALFISTLASASQSYWNDISSPAETIRTKAFRQSSEFRLVELDLIRLQAYLASSSQQHETRLRDSQFFIELPHPDGHTAVFKIVENQVLHPELSACFRDIKTYSGQGIDDPAATLKFDMTMYGFHAMIISPNGTYLINPVSDNTYMSFLKSKAILQTEPMKCHFGKTDQESETGQRIENAMKGVGINSSIGGELRTYRLALATTGEYSTYHGGTISSVLAAMVIAINRVNGVYEREFGITLQLIPNDTLLIFLNATTDPFTNNDGFTMLGQNQNTCDNIIGSANYDIGHVFSTGGGGIAQLSCICKAGSKARGVTGLYSPIGDAFYIDYVAHEMGHQFGGNHIFNSTVGSCGGGNRSANSAYEPGSGSTIMGYAGICGSQNLQTHSHDYFNTHNFDEIINYTQMGIGNNCPAYTTISNQAPLINSVTPNSTIPMSTPFRLTASAYDPDGDSITYCWEERDLGPAGNWNTPTGNAPIFRSFLPVSSPTRIFPKIINILNNNTSIGEFKPNYARQLKFRCTVRDNVLAGAGVTYNDIPVTLTVDGNSGPFEITYPNTTGITWLGNSVEAITWNVANTDQSPVNCQLVNILLSVDGGYNYPFTLATGVTNSGSCPITVPNISTSTARIMVEANGNIFFDINDKNFSISPVSVHENNFASSVSVVPDPSFNQFIISMLNEEKGTVRIHILDPLGRMVYSSESQKTDTRFTHIADMSSLAEGNYYIRIELNNQLNTVKKVVKLTN